MCGGWLLRDGGGRRRGGGGEKREEGAWSATVIVAVGLATVAAFARSFDRSFAKEVIIA